MSDSPRRLLLITGTGRSGTSAMSGIFHHLGVEVPGPHIGANESNPKGFFESRWSFRFHNELCQRAHMHVMDARPTAFDDLQAVITPADHAKMRRWIGKVSEGHDVVVVKDPRTVWTQQMWREEAAANGLTINYISMLRHPAETIGSRSTYYAASADVEKRRRYEIFNVSRWVNNQLISERETRGERRAFVRYVDLLEDWRATITHLVDSLELPVDVARGGGRSPVDDFVSPDLRRVRTTWGDLAVPESLANIAEQVWEAVNALADGDETSDVHARLDALADDYDELFRISAAIAHDAAEDRIQEVREETRTQMREEIRAEVLGEAPERTVDVAPGLTEVGGRDLLREVGSRVRRRFRPSRESRA